MYKDINNKFENISGEQKTIKNSIAKCKRTKFNFYTITKIKN